MLHDNMWCKEIHAHRTTLMAEERASAEWDPMKYVASGAFFRQRRELELAQHVNGSPRRCRRPCETGSRAFRATYCSTCSTTSSMAALTTRLHRRRSACRGGGARIFLHRIGGSRGGEPLRHHLPGRLSRFNLASSSLVATFLCVMF
jgi:hypothetical protein